MIDARSIRIGNRILFEEDSAIAEVIAFDMLGVNVILGDIETWIELELFAGIPLTPEWLERFGFKDSYAGHYLENPTPYNFVLSKETIFYNGIAINCKYVHQLQNLYWCLCGKELELKN